MNNPSHNKHTLNPQKRVYFIICTVESSKWNVIEKMHIDTNAIYIHEKWIISMSYGGFVSLLCLVEYFSLLHRWRYMVTKLLCFRVSFYLWFLKAKWFWCEWTTNSDSYANKYSNIPFNKSYVSIFGFIGKNIVFFF